jgi:hypothetical protein
MSAALFAAPTGVCQKKNMDRSPNELWHIGIQLPVVKGIAGSGSFSSTAETDYLSSVTLTWNVKAASQTVGGCLYGTSTDPLDSVVAWAGGADQNNKCGPYAPGGPLLPFPS